MTGLYLAYGWSAYYVTMVVYPKIAFSEVMEMLVALLDWGEIKELRFSMKMLSHTLKDGQLKFSVRFDSVTQRDQ